MLDTAVSSKQHRPQFLKCLQNMRSISVDKYCTNYGKSVVLFYRWKNYLWRWLSNRQIFVESIKLRKNDARSDMIIPSLRNVVSFLFEDDDVRFLIRNCPLLRSLCLEFTNVSHIGLGLLTNLSQSLEELTIDLAEIDDRAQVAAALIDVLRQCTRLRKVSLALEALRAVNLNELLPYGHLFHELHLHSGRGESSVGAYVQSISTLVTTCNGLRKLVYFGGGIEEDSLVLSAIHQSCPLLEELDLSAFSFAYADGFALITRKCKHIRTLQFAHSHVSPSIVRSIAHMEAINDLAFNECKGLTDVEMAMIVTMRLKELCFFNCKNLIDVSRQSFVGSNISRTLESFALINSNFTTSSVDDIQLAISLASCHNLKKIFVRSSNPWVFGSSGLEGLEALAAGCPLLAEVYLDLTDSGIHYLAAHCANLKTCMVFNRRADSISPVSVSFDDLRTLYPAVEWQ